MPKENLFKIRGRGRTKTISISKIRKIIAVLKKRSLKGIRVIK